MKLAVISDLHLGAGGAADAFGHDDAEFLRFLLFLENNFERIVLLGDIWETLTSKTFGHPERELARARARHAEIARRFSRSQYTYVHGNHDLVSGVLGAPDELVVDADGLRLLFTHGHQNDPLVKGSRWLSELGVWMGGWIRRFGLGPLYRLARQLDGLRGGATLDPSSCRFQRWAVEVARMRDADVVVTGHTHLATRAEHGDRLFLNSGSCADGRYSFTSMDTRSGSYLVHSQW
jgi:predicted phosphodiesterase